MEALIFLDARSSFSSDLEHWTPGASDDGGGYVVAAVVAARGESSNGLASAKTATQLIVNLSQRNRASRRDLRSFSQGSTSSHVCIAIQMIPRRSKMDKAQG